MSEVVKEEKIRKVFLDNLPRYKGKNNGSINWTESIGYNIRFIYDDIEGEINLIDYKKPYLYIKYLNKPIFKIANSNFLKCKIAFLLDKKVRGFKISIGDKIKDEKRDLIITDCEHRKEPNSRKYYKYTCNKCGWTEGWIREDAILLQNQGCSCCSGRNAIVGINSIIDTDDWMTPYFQGGYDEAKLYTKTGSGNIENRECAIYPICPDCGEIKHKKIKINDIYRNHSIGCTCGDKISYPNKFAYSLLNQLNEAYKFEHLEHEYSPEWVGRRSYDNYFIHNEKEYILEMDGKWHIEDNNMSGQSKEKSKAIDNHKDKLAREHNIEVIRIDCKISELEFIKQNMLNSKLNELFDLSIIDWLKCEEFALSNLCKIAWDYKRNNPKITTKEIGNIIGVHQATVGRYLKIGTKLKKCNYNPEEEHKLNTKNAIKSTSKKVEVFKNGKSKGVFNSISELQRESAKIFGKKLFDVYIINTCKGIRESYNGFVFKYVTE